MEQRAGLSEAPAAALAWGARLLLPVSGAGLVATGWMAARASQAGVPTGALLLAWFAAFAAVLLGLVGLALERRAGLRRRRGVAFVLLVSALAQAPLVVAPPALSDDAWRYLHDGRVAAAGVDPWRHAPNDPALDAVAGVERPLVNNAGVRTVYPPVAIGVFALLHALGGGLILLKAVLALAGLGLSLLVARLLPEGRRETCLAVAWHPLLVLEVAGSGHVDVLGAVLLVAGLAAIARSRRSLAAVLLSLGAGVKLLPGLLALPLARRLGLLRAALVVSTLVACAVPALVQRQHSGGEQGLAAYARHWDFNSPTYPLVRWAVESVRLKDGLDALLSGVGRTRSDWTAPQVTSRLILAAAMAWVLLAAFRRSQPSSEQDGPWRAAHFAVGGLLLLTPTLHPWYLVWILPLSVLRASPAWLYLSGAVGLSYATALGSGGGAWVEAPWPRALEYLPFALLLGASWLRPRRVD